MKTHRLNIYLIIGMLIFVGIILAQPNPEWVIAYDHEGNNDFFLDVFATHDGGYICCGYSNPTFSSRHSSTQALFAKFSEDGALEWARLHGDNDIYDEARDIIQTDDNTFLAVGQKNITIVAWMLTVNGDVIWYREYGIGAGNSVIELKGGNFILGCGGTESAKIIQIDRDGEVIWETSYLREDAYSCNVNRIRETEGGIIGVGRSVFTNPTRSAGLIMKVDFNGNTQFIRHDDVRNQMYSRFVSAHDDGFVITSICQGNDSHLNPVLIEIDDDGNIEERREIGGGSGIGIVKIPNGGYLVIGQHYGYRFDTDLSIIWQNQYFVDDLNEFIVSTPNMSRVVIGNDGSYIGCGMIQVIEERGVGIPRDAFIMKLRPSVVGVQFIDWSPRDTLLNVLLGDSLQFIVSAANEWNDEMDYQWTLGDSLIGRDTTVTVVFEDLGDFEINCQVSARESISQITWHVGVRDMLISNHVPDTLSLVVQRTSIVDFAIEIRAVEGDPVNTEWTISELPNGEEEVISRNLTASHQFSFTNDYAVDAYAWRGETIDRRTWLVSVKSIISDYWPRTSEVLTDTNNILLFRIMPFDPESNTLDIEWYVDNEVRGFETSIDLSFAQYGDHLVKVYVRDGLESDSILWDVKVRQPSKIWIEELLHNRSFTLHPAHPNPFNRQTTLRFDLPSHDMIKLAIYDTQGRLVKIILNDYRSAGSYTVEWDASGYSAGVYLIKLETGAGYRSVRKVVLVP